MGKLAERLHRDRTTGGIYDQDRRYVMMRADVLMGLFLALPPDERERALHGLAASVESSGGASAHAYFEAVGRDRVALLDVMTESAADLGWGRWRFNTDDSRKLTLTVHSSPFAAMAMDMNAPACHAIVGMFRTVGLLCHGGPVTVVETQCAAQGAPCCTFEAARSSEN